MREVNFLQDMHKATKRDYIARVLDNKPHCCEVAKQFGKDYWDGDRRYGYGGYVNDGRWKKVAKSMIDFYGITPEDRIFDIGYGKGYLLDEFAVMHPLRHNAMGVDISHYAASHDMDGFCRYDVGNCTKIHYPNAACDLVYSINVFHNLGAKDLKLAVQEMMRLAKPKSNKYICVESYRNETEKCNLLNWQLTCQQFHSPDDWKWLLQEYGYDGDIEFIYFE